MIILKTGDEFKLKNGKDERVFKITSIKEFSSIFSSEAYVYLTSSDGTKVRVSLDEFYDYFVKVDKDKEKKSTKNKMTKWKHYGFIKVLGRIVELQYRHNNKDIVEVKSLDNKFLVRGIKHKDDTFNLKKGIKVCELKIVKKIVDDELSKM